MKRKKIIKTAIIVSLSGLLIGLLIISYLLNMPHKDISKSKADYILTSSALVTEYLSNPSASNEKYLNSDGDSKVLVLTGTLVKLSKNYNQQTVALLKEANDKAGVNAIFEAPDFDASLLRIGEPITIKGVIRLGASYDPDLEMYEHAIVEHSTLIINN